MRDEYHRGAAYERDGCKIAHRIVRRSRPHERNEPQRAAVREQSVTVRRRLGRDVGDDDASYPVVDDHLLAYCFGQSLRDQPRREVTAAPELGGEHAQRPVRIDLTVRNLCSG